MTLVKDKPLLANPDIVYREEEDGAFLFDPNTGDLKCLNPIGSVIWLLCDGSLSFDQIEHEVSKKYPQIPRETVCQELQSFFQELFDTGYLGYQLSKDSSEP